MGLLNFAFLATLYLFETSKALTTRCPSIGKSYLCSNLNENQMNFMASEKLAVVNMNDEIIGEYTKMESHTFGLVNTRGLLHRAFSVFLFNSKGQLLIQQRAEDKITFPGVWSNTCCSHPIVGSIPNEIDTIENIKIGKVEGIKAAAIRKLKHELGIESNSVNSESLKYLTRLHYWAADKHTHGELSPWGEHEIDYILFVKADVDHTPNLEEVKDAKYVTMSELQSMMDPSSGLLWSPWFRIIAKKFLEKWWIDLDLTLSTNKFVNYEKIFRFDPSPEHYGGAGAAGAWLGSAEALSVE